MLVIISWYSDGSDGKPFVYFLDGWTQELEPLIKLIRDTEHKQCVVYQIAKEVSVVYDSSIINQEEYPHVR